MLSGATAKALAMAGTAVFRIVVYSDSMKNPTATSHGNSRFTESGIAGPVPACPSIGLAASVKRDLLPEVLSPADQIGVTVEEFICSDWHRAGTKLEIHPRSGGIRFRQAGVKVTANPTAGEFQQGPCQATVPRPEVTG